MPTYEYVCNQCGHRFEKFHSMTAEPVRTCPECGGAVKRLLGSGAGVIFKGEGSHSRDAGPAPRCGREAPCCGRDIPCDTPDCEK